MVMWKAIACRSLRTGGILLLLLGNRSAYSQLQNSGPRGPEPSSSDGIKAGLMEGQRQDSPRVFLRDVWHDQKVIWTSPVRMNRRQGLGIALPLAAGTAALIATDRRYRAHGRITVRIEMRRVPDEKPYHREAHVLV
jgi:hypothetical protein